MKKLICILMVAVCAALSAQTPQYLAKSGGALTGTLFGKAAFFANGGVFTDTQQNSYMRSAVNGLDPGVEYTTLFSGHHATNGFDAGIAVPSSSTVFQANGVAGMVTNASGAATAAVGVFGSARAIGQANGRIWGGNFIATDTVGNPTTVYGAEIDTNGYNATSVPIGLLIASYFNTQPNLSIALQVGPPQGTNMHWSYGVRFDTGVTNALNSNNAAIEFYPVSTAANSPSQGLFFIANAPGSGIVGAGLQFMPNDQFAFGAGATFAGSVNVTNTTSSLLPAGTASGVTGDVGVALGSGTGTNYGVIGVAKAAADVGGDRAYGGWFKASAQNLATSEVGMHAEVNDGGGTIAEFAQGGSVKSSIFGDGSFKVGANIVIPATASGNAGNSAGKVVLVYTGTTGSIGGGALTAGNCATGTVTVGASATGHPGIAAASDGSVQGNYVLNVSVSGTTATVSVCAIAAGTPTAKTYNVTVF